MRLFEVILVSAHMDGPRATSPGKSPNDLVCGYEENTASYLTPSDVLDWLKAHYKLGKGGFIEKRLIYKDYIELCQRQGAQPLISPTFLGKLVKRAFPSIRCLRKGPRGQVRQCYALLKKLKNPASSFPATDNGRLIRWAHESPRASETHLAQAQSPYGGYHRPPPSTADIPSTFLYPHFESTSSILPPNGEPLPPSSHQDPYFWNMISHGGWTQEQARPDTSLFETQERTSCCVCCCCSGEQPPPTFHSANPRPLSLTQPDHLGPLLRQSLPQLTRGGMCHTQQMLL